MDKADYPRGLFMVKLRDGLGSYEHGPCQIGPSGEVVFAATNSPIKPQIIGWRELTLDEAMHCRSVDKERSPHAH